MKRLCKTCGAEYEPKYYKLLGAKILRGGGLCPDCVQVEIDKLKASELREIQESREYARTHCGIPPMFMDKTFDNFQRKNTVLTKAYDECLKYAEDFPSNKRPFGYRSLWLYSENAWRVGKTHLASAIAHRILDRWDGEEYAPHIVFVSEPELFRKIQATYSFSPEEKQHRQSEDAIIRSVIYAGLVILDDVGKERRQDPRFIQRTLFAIVDGRQKHKLPLVLTSNLTPIQMKNHLGLDSRDEATFLRLVEMCGGKVIDLTGESYRGK